MLRKPQKDLFTRLTILLMLAFVLLPMLTACGEPSDSNGGTEQTTPAESGTLSEGTPALIPDPEKPKAPANPEKTLYATSQELYNDAPRGCQTITVLAEFTKGLDYDVFAKKDTNTKQYRLYLPCRVDPASVTYTVTHKDGKVSGPYTVDLSDTTVTDNERVVGNNNSYQIIAMQSNLPTVMVQIDEAYGTIKQMNADKTHNTFTYGDMVTTVTDALALEKGWSTRYESKDTNPKKECSLDMRGRGNTTWVLAKKPYQIRSENEIDLLGMGLGTTYALMANYRDATGARTQIALDLGVAIGLEYTVAQRQVDFFLNGTYMGMYVITEKIEVAPNRVEIDQKTEFLFEVDQYYNQNGNVGIGFPQFDEQCRFRIHNDDDAAHVEKGKQILTNAFTALYSGNEQEFLKYFDLDSWARMYLFQMYSMNSDAYHGSLFFYYSEKDQKLHACSPWDFDWSFGGSHREDPKWWDPYVCDRSQNGISKPMLQYNAFLTKICDLYYKEKVRDVLATVPAMVKVYEEENRLSFAMNETAAAVFYYPSGKATNYTEACAHLYTTCVERLNWMDSKVQSHAAKAGYLIPLT
ncbi:MAG: CotH kinase family protein [Clostridia bacterium]|nr:CotH kinase family protein [Clostridia bacterium]